MEMKKIHTVLLVFAALFFVHFANAQSNIIKVIVPYAPGGNVDNIARVYSKYIGEKFNETWIVENVSGANGIIGAAQVAKSKADGTTLLFSADVHSMSSLVIKSVPYDAIKDFTPISLVAKAPLIFVVNADLVKAMNLTQLVEEIKAEPQRFNFGISGAGSAPQLGAEIFKFRSGLSVPTINYRGTGPAVADLAGGHVNLMTVTPLAVMPFIKSGKLRALAVTSKQRFIGAIDIPTTAEAGMPGFEVENSYGFWGPKGVPVNITNKISGQIKQASQDPNLQKRLLELGVVATWVSPEDTVKHISQEFNRNKEVYIKANIKPE
jgi:tripartite-type tricarboxylate transporter receptor subunit TctC